MLTTRQDVLKNDINIEVVERFLGYYDIQNTQIRLKDYQKRASDNVTKIFKDHKFAQVILPTGAGKSFVALAQMQKYAMEHPNEKMLYLAPQEEILNQIKSYVIKYIHGKQGTIGKTEDEIIAELFPNITFETYSGLLAKRGQETIKDQYGMIVLDELHRTGAKEWEGKVDSLLKNQNDNVKVLGITATPTRDVDGRDMANETARKLGYTEEEIKKRKHIASNMTLENAIRMGYVVNPKIVYCKYDLISSGKMDELRAKIDEIEDEDGNRIGTKTGEDKIKSYQEYLKKVFAGTKILPKCLAMSGSWNGKNRNKNGEDQNQQELNAFETDDSEETKFMVVMNKANEGLHIEGVDGIIWFRALDENSRILYLQQLGRAIYALDEDNPLPDDKRPTIIDLANNSLTVKIEKDFENSEPIDDLEALTIVAQWINEHDGMIPDRNSSNKQEQHYYAVLRRIQNKYSKYLDGFDNFEELEDEEKERIQEIIDLATEIDLWNMELPPIAKLKGHSDDLYSFEVTGVLRDFVELQEDVNNIGDKTTYEEIIEWLETHDGKMPRMRYFEDGSKKKAFDMTEDEKYEVNLKDRWRRSREYQVLNQYSGRPIEEVPEEFREKIATLRKFGLGIKKGKLSQAKQQRDKAKSKNDQAKELEQQVSGELKKRGKEHEEQ